MMRRKKRVVPISLTFEGDIKGDYKVNPDLKEQLKDDDDIDLLMSAQGFYKSVHMYSNRQVISNVYYCKRNGSEQILKKSVEKLLRRSKYDSEHGGVNKG